MPTRILRCLAGAVGLNRREIGLCSPHAERGQSLDRAMAKPLQHRQVTQLADEENILRGLDLSSEAKRIIAVFMHRHSWSNTTTFEIVPITATRSGEITTAISLETLLVNIVVHTPNKSTIHHQTGVCPLRVISGKHSAIRTNFS